jgi:hypothetical protein
MATGIEARAVPTKLLKQPTTSEQRSQAKRQIMVALSEMAVFRGAVPTELYLRAYSQRLSREYLPGVLESLAKIGDAEREDGEPALPTMGTILKNRPVRTDSE